ncbi:carbohydrate porin [Sphingomonas sp. AR_OL41]|uniref:carbohydrate porin n=1 Tax=Sphingomonas sp. AR_OL41 TaxID=3042729 RepID=UPI0024803C29|nr:carbohydrate porin [Sphingomonas sp. AR_OL41]MDH7972833.1 carbohydrate porin [Sphingomonas sp. AR_OL41]
MAMFDNRPCTAQAQHNGTTVRDEMVAATDRRDAALSWSVIYTSDANADVGGGSRTGAAYLQRIGLIGELDLQSTLGWRGARAHISVHAIAGTGLSAHRVGNVLTVSGIEAEPALRLFNLWIEQKLGNRVTLRAGQFNADQQFAISATAGHLVNATFGWPGSFASDLPSGGPAYPLAAPGASLTLALRNRATMRLALFAGDPAGPGGGDPQRRDLHGFNGLRFKGGPFVIGEVQHSAQGPEPAWSFTLGAWAHFDRFDDLRYDMSGTTLAAPNATGRPRTHPGNAAIYAIGDLRLWNAGPRSLDGFVRVTASPGDRNGIDLYADAGVALTGPIRPRPHDIFALGVAVARFSPSLRATVEGHCALAGAPCHTPAFEAAFEAGYHLILSPRLSVQPNVQLIIHPSAALMADPADRYQIHASAVVVGLRTSFRH